MPSPRNFSSTVVLWVSVFLVACGGGGTSGPIAQPPNYVELTSPAALSSSVDLANNTVNINWKDTFPAGSSYIIQTIGPGTLTTVSTQAASGTGNTLSYSQSISSTTEFQVVAAAGGQTFKMQTAQGQTTVTATMPNAAPTIMVTPSTSGLNGTVTLSLDNNFAYPSVTWFVDTTRIGTSSGVGAPLQWVTTGTTNGQHVIFAVINLTASSAITVRKQVSVTNSNLAVNVTNRGTSGTVLLDVTASSTYPITSVEGKLNGVSIGILTSPNACSRYCPGTNDIYQFSFNSAIAGSGPHAFVATAVDAAGSFRTATLPIAVSNPPNLSLISPFDGAFVNGAGNLSISGTASSDKAGGVTVTAFLGSLPITVTQPTASTFSGMFSLAGLPAGPYTLTVNSKDNTGVTTTKQSAIVVTSSIATTFAPSFTIGSTGQLIAVDSSNPALVLYKASDGSYRIRNTTANSETTLQGASSIPFLYNWAMDGGHVFVEGGYLGLTSAGYSNCPSSCIYMWTPSGVKSNISNGSPNNKVYEQYPKVHDGYVIWIDYAGANPGTYTLYNIATGVYTKINQPNGANYLGNTSYDFAVTNGVVNFFYWAQTGSGGTTSNFDVYQWSSSTNTSILVSNSGFRSIYPQTDGIRVAWSQAPTSTANGGLSSLITRSVSGVVNTTLSAGMSNFKVADGVVAWVEGVSSTNAQGIQTTTVTALKALNPSGVTSIVTSSPTAELYGIGKGMVVFGVQNKTYIWSAASPQISSLLIDTAPGNTLISGSTLYFTQGANQAVYKVTIE